MAYVEEEGTTGEVATVPAGPIRAAEEGGVRASIIVPTLNEVKVLGGLLAALGPARRHRHGLEVIVSDGGSDDGTIELAQALSDNVVVHEGSERQTIAAGRNAGAEAASGSLLLFLNADVRFPDDVDGFIESILHAAQRHGAATCRVAVHPDEARLQDRLVLGGCNLAFYTWNLIGLGMGRGECHALRRDVFQEVGGYDETLAAGEDFDLYRRIARWGKQSGDARVAFLWEHVLWEDPRRYRKLGYVRTLYTWLRNSVYVTFAGRSHSDVWEPVR